MKKTLAIVLALAMVLCMIPAAFAGTSKTVTITDQSYALSATAAGEDKGLTYSASASGNTVTINYDYEAEDVDQTGKFTEDKKMALVTVAGFDSSLQVVADEDILVDGKILSSNSFASYNKAIGFNATNHTLTFPVELTKAGYTDSFVLTVKGKASASSDEVITEVAKVSVKLINKAAYKTAKTASIVSVESDDTKWMNAYIVGSKLYLDYVSEPADTSRKVEVNFADENGAKFSEVTWAYTVKKNVLTVANEVSDKGTPARYGNKLDKSAISYAVKDPVALNGTKIKFELETAAAIYETKEYTVVVRTGVKEADPKGIYFADSTKTIKRGETYVPVVMGVATGKAVTPDKIHYGTNTSKEVIDIEDNKKVIGTKEGVAYITAEYTPAQGTPYTSSSMKIIVTEGEVAPAEGTTTTYYVTCRTLNVRKGAGTSYAKAGKLHRGDKVEVVSISKNWAKLANGTYVSAKYIAK